MGKQTVLMHWDSLPLSLNTFKMYALGKDTGSGLTV